MRGVAIERYTAREVAKILHEHDKVDHVDFVPGGRVIHFFTEKEYEDALKDYEAAEAAGVDLTEVVWVTKEEVQKVQIFTIVLNI